MVLELVFRFIIGGLGVCAFAVIGTVLKPKSLGGIFGAAPSVALATLGLTFATHGGSYVGIEGKSMIAGAIGLACYSLAACILLSRRTFGALVSSGASGVAWFALAFGIWGIFLR